MCQDDVMWLCVNLAEASKLVTATGYSKDDEGKRSQNGFDVLLFQCPTTACKDVAWQQLCVRTFPFFFCHWLILGSERKWERAGLSHPLDQ